MGNGRARSPPKELVDLLDAPDRAATDGAWEAFLKRHSGTILDAAWCKDGNYDGQMDRYAFILEQLRRDDFKRLRSYTANPRARFSTWLTVVCRRLCVDFLRDRYGRDRSSDRISKEAIDLRRRLVDLVAEELDPDGTRDRRFPGPEEEARRAELFQALESALSDLQSEDRLLLKLRFQDDLSARDVAQVLRIPTVFRCYRRLNSALGFLRRRLEAQGIEGPEP